MKPSDIVFGTTTVLPLLRDDLKAGRFVPLPVRERMIPKASGKVRRLGIPTARDRCVQASLKLVLEPIFEADFKPCSYGFRPRRRPHDAIAEIHMFATQGYTWVLEGDITACFDEISHSALLQRMRHRIGDKRVMGLVKEFLHAGVLSEDGVRRDTKTGTPQGGILSPLLANIALSVLDEYFVGVWERDMATRRRVPVIMTGTVHRPMELTIPPLVPDAEVRADSNLVNDLGYDSFSLVELTALIDDAADSQTLEWPERFETIRDLHLWYVTLCQAPR